jgi:hypothetical protein
MSHKIILLIAGKKQSGKNTLANRIVADFMNRTKLSKGSPYRYEVDDQGEIFLWNPSGSREKTHISVEAGIATEEFIRQSGVRSMAFATPLKQFCMEVFGLHKKQCYGSDADKNTNTLLYWEDQPFWTRVKYARHAATHKSLPWYRRPFNARVGLMTAREVMQVFGTDMIRRVCQRAWINAGLNMALRVPEKLVIITDCRFANEVAAADEMESVSAVSYTIRLMRDPLSGTDRHISETAIDSVPLSTFDIVVPESCSADQAFDYVMRMLNNWYLSAGIIPAEGLVNHE